MATRPGRRSRRRALAIGAAVVAVAALGAATIAFVFPATRPQSVTAAPLRPGVYCQGEQPGQPASGPTKVVLITLENESSTTVERSEAARFQRTVLSAQCGSFAPGAMHSTTHGSEGNYLAAVSGLNPAIDAGPDARARFALSDCAPDSAKPACTYGGGHLDASVPSLFSQLEQRYGTAGWKTYSDSMPEPCRKQAAGVYATVNGVAYLRYVSRHNPAVFFTGIHCTENDLPAGDWKSHSGPLYDSIVHGTLPPFTLLQPDDIENGHDPVRLNGVTVAGGASQLANIDHYLTQIMSLIRSGRDYQSGRLVVMITFDEGAGGGPIVGDDKVGQNCADPDVSPLATSCQIQTWIVGRYVPHHVYRTYMNQFGLLAATERILKLPRLLGHAADPTTPDIVGGTTAAPDPFNLSSAGAR